MIEIFREFRFEAAHHLPAMPEGHKCRRMHGHSYRVVIHVEGTIDLATGMVRDFADMEACWNEHIFPLVDHHLLNEIPELQNPTAEELAGWIYGKWITHFLQGASKVEVWETERAGATFTRPAPRHTHGVILTGERRDDSPVRHRD